MSKPDDVLALAKRLAELFGSNRPAAGMTLVTLITGPNVERLAREVIRLSAPASSGDEKLVVNRCPLSFAHMPHDYCDGSPADSRAAPVSQAQGWKFTRCAECDTPAACSSFSTCGKAAERLRSAALTPHEVDDICTALARVGMNDNLIRRLRAKFR